MERIPATAHLYDQPPPKRTRSGRAQAGLAILWLTVGVIGVVEVAGGLTNLARPQTTVLLCRGVQLLGLGLTLFMTWRGNTLGRVLLSGGLLFSALNGLCASLALGANILGALPGPLRPLWLIIQSIAGGGLGAFAYGVCAGLILTPMVGAYQKEC